jgi:tetratricopeptide (TPR) repeat protein
MWKPDRFAARTKPAAPAPAGSGFPFAARSGGRSASEAPSHRHSPDDRVPVWLWVLLAALLVQRGLYHAAYFRLDPFALVTISDGQLYERAARDILAVPYWGEEPFYLQGAYAYLLAAGIAITDSVVGGLLLQLLAAGAATVLFGLAARTCFGRRVGAYSTAVLLALPSLAFYENKYLSVSLGVGSCMLLLWAFARVMTGPTFSRVFGFGLVAGLAVLARPNLLLAVPFCAIAAMLAAQRRTVFARGGLFVMLLLGAGVVLAPMSLRNFVVTGSPTVFPSHGGGIPFFIGNNPDANGRWNDANGLLSGQVWFEREELARRLNLVVPEGSRVATLDTAIGNELYNRAFTFIREQPADWLGLEAVKAWFTLGNHAFVRDYDLLGERELLGPWYPFGLPFGIALGLGTLGLILLCRRAIQARHEAAHAALCSVLLGIVFAVLAANLLWFTSAQNRAPLLVPLAFAAGPAIDTIVRRVRRSLPKSALPTVAWVVALLLAVQAFVPRMPTDRPSSVHYYNLGNVEEVLGRKEAALEHYRIATERNPKQAMFWWRRALVARDLRRLDETRRSLDQLLALPDLPAELRNATLAARRSIPERPVGTN